MNVTLIDEELGNPFRRILPVESGRHTNGRRYEDPSTFRLVMSDLLCSLGLSASQTTALEIGIGEQRGPSRALAELGATVNTLDISPNDEIHTDLWKKRVDLESLVGTPVSELTFRWFGRVTDFQEPILGGITDDGVYHYVGDAAFVNHPLGAFATKKCDIIYFWGSINGAGHNFSLGAYSRQNPTCSLEERFAKPISLLAPGGYLLAVSGFMNRCGCPGLEPDNIPRFNQSLLDVALSTGTHSERRVSDLIVYGLSKPFAFDYLHKEGRGEEWSHRPFTEEGISLALGAPKVPDARKDLLSPDQLASLDQIGIIDAVAVRYE